MAWQHENLSKTIVHLLADNGICLAIAGFHTGRQKVAGFFRSIEKAGLVPVRPIFERDLEGRERTWVTDRGPEDPIERKRYEKSTMVMPSADLYHGDG